MLSYVLMTNGGGALEHVKAEAVSSVLGLHVPESAVIVAHTPMRVSCSAVDPTPPWYPLPTALTCLVVSCLSWASGCTDIAACS